jgi:hypothetical protein
VCEPGRLKKRNGRGKFDNKMSALRPDGLQSHATTPRKGRQDGKAAAMEASTAASNSPELALSGPHMKDEVNDARRQASLSARNCTQ